MKQIIAKFLLFVYLEYIKEDWNIYKPFAKMIIFPFWIIRSSLIWIVCPLLIPDYLIRQSSTYKNFQQLATMTPRQIKEFDKQLTKKS